MFKFMKDLPERLTWWLMIKLTKRWAEHYMDQWEKVKFDIKNSGNNTIYLTISRQDPYPDSFDKIDQV